jgi:hypothetical protein
MYELFSDIYFVVYKLYYIGQNDNLGIRVSLKNWDRGSTVDDSVMTSSSSWGLAVVAAADSDRPARTDSNYSMALCC